MIVQPSVEVQGVKEEADIVSCRVTAKAMAEALGFDYLDQTRIATTVSELTRNALKYGNGGEITLRPIVQPDRVGLEVVVVDHGPGIQHLELALKGGHSTGGGLGMGLAGSRRLMDEFEIDTKPGKGTTVVARKWRPA